MLWQLHLSLNQPASNSKENWSRQRQGQLDLHPPNDSLKPNRCRPQAHSITFSVPNCAYSPALLSGGRLARGVAERDVACGFAG
jgi:hypothetical protein